MESPLGFCFVAILMIFDILSSLQHEVYFMGGGAVTSPNMVAILATILDFIKN